MRSPTITPTTLTSTAAVSAVVAGLLFIGVQVNHPRLDAAYATTTDYQVRETLKIMMALLSFAGITGMYLRQVRQTGLLGLVGYVVLGAGYLMIMATEVMGALLIPALAPRAPAYVNDVLAAATGGATQGDIGQLQTLFVVTGIAYLSGGLLFGIALFRARVLARWAAVLLALGTFSSLAIHVLPQVNQRLFALPTGVALVGLGWSLWRDQRAAAVAPLTAAPAVAAGAR